MAAEKRESRNKNEWIAYVLIAVGVLYLLGGALDFGLLWPVLVMLPGVPFLYFANKGGKTASGLVIPGAIIVGTGVLMLAQNVTNHWESWAYAWTLYPVFIGLGLNFMGERHADNNLRRTGRRMVRIGMTMFVVLGVFFEFLIFHSILSNPIVPIVLILVGVRMLRRRRHEIGDAPRMVMTAKRKTADAPLKRKRTLQEEIDEAVREDEQPHPEIV